MININKIISLFLMSLLISACAAYSEKSADPSTSELIACEEPRPQICTREYNPVCATYKDGSKKTGSTGCTSCSDPDVIGYKMAACKADIVD